MLRCITNAQVQLYAPACEESSTRQLSRANLLLCPNCLKEVTFSRGPKKGSYFSHRNNADCVVTYYERETKQHLQGKDILLNWLEKRFSDATVEVEKHIPETKQIADILVTHTSGPAKGSKWAFEFQHSPLSTKEWQQRHELYQEAGIHDFWIFDTDIFLKHSRSKDPYIQKARNKKDPVETVFETTGFCYFLKLDTSVITIDFSFRYEDIRGEDKHGRRFPPQEYKFHDPYDHSCKLGKIKFKYNEEFNFAAMTYKENSKGINSRFERQIREFETKKQQKWDEELKVRARKKKEYADEYYGKDYSGYIWIFMKANKEEVKHDVFDLSEEEFFSKYNKYALKLQTFGEEINNWEDSKDYIHLSLYRLCNESEKEKIKKISFLEQQNTSLENYFTDKFSNEIENIKYVLNKYDYILEKLTSFKPKFAQDKLSDINWRIAPYKDKPTKFDYAYQYHHMKTKDEVDDFMKEVEDAFTSPYIDISEL
ncbi:competence protein CoiA [Priestia megaterium]|uniref:competence protein CoiA n=1 Tax=Priestia megaterium TaxID=1404 RepID=UPI002E1B9D02|nr:competence protein CoiA family protein [Priestia megaterium]